MSDLSSDGPNPSGSDAQSIAAALIAEGEALAARGELISAQTRYRQACTADPDNAEAHFKLGTALYHAGDNETAVFHLQHALAQRPEDPRVLNNLGAVLGRLRRYKEAIHIFVQAFAVDPQNAAAAMNCGRLLVTLGQVAEGERWLTQANQVRPGHSETLRLLAEARLALGQPHLAIGCGEKAVAADPKNPFAHLALGQAYLGARRLQSARHHLKTYVKAQPNDPKGYFFLGEVESKSGRTAIAHKLYKHVLGLDIDDQFRSMLALKSASILPVINTSDAEIQTHRARIESALDTLSRPEVDDPYLSGGFTNFYLGYHGRNDVEIQKSMAQFYLDCCPALAATAPHIGTPPRTGKRRVGILSSFLRNHTVGYLNHGLIEHLDRERFEIVLLRTPILPIGDPLADKLTAMADEVIDLPDALVSARNLVFGAELDLLYFPEIGMEDLVYFLAFARSAPVQVMGWGHPVTSGIPNVDAFLSVADMEPDGAQAHYSERLVALDGLSVCMPKPGLPENGKTKDGFGIDPDAPAYVCAQSLFKILPACDTLFKEILERDPSGRLYFLSLETDSDDVFLSRLEKTLGPLMSRVKILKRVSSADFLSLLKAADMLLDIPHWAGGKTSFESLAMGTPIVHWPGAFMRGRHTLAFYKKMGVMDCVVDSAEAYAETAVRLVHDHEFRQRIRAAIAENSDVIFNDTSAIAEISDVFDRLITEARHA